MLKKLILSLAALIGLSAMLPREAEARGRYHGYDDGYYDPYYRGGYYAPRSYGYGHYVPRRHARQHVYRDYGYRDRHYGRRHAYRDYGYRDRYYGRRHRCGSGTTGAIIGGAAGALLGREIGRGGRGYYSYRRGNGTTGAIVGGAAGALIGREIGRSC